MENLRNKKNREMKSAPPFYVKDDDECIPFETCNDVQQYGHPNNIGKDLLYSEKMYNSKMPDILTDPYIKKKWIVDKSRLPYVDQFDFIGKTPKLMVGKKNSRSIIDKNLLSKKCDNFILTSNDDHFILGDNMNNIGNDLLCGRKMLIGKTPKLMVGKKNNMISNETLYNFNCPVKSKKKNVNEKKINGKINGKINRKINRKVNKEKIEGFSNVSDDNFKLFDGSWESVFIMIILFVVLIVLLMSLYTIIKYFGKNEGGEIIDITDGDSLKNEFNPFENRLSETNLIMSPRTILEKTSLENDINPPKLTRV